MTIDEYIIDQGLPEITFTEEWWLCECQFKGSSSTPILMKVCDYHKLMQKWGKHE